MKRTSREVVVYVLFSSEVVFTSQRSILDEVSYRGWERKYIQFYEDGSLNNAQSNCVYVSKLQDLYINLGQLRKLFKVILYVIFPTSHHQQLIVGNGNSSIFMSMFYTVFKTFKCSYPIIT